MKSQDPISDAFREKLSQLEADPGPGTWEAIQAKIGAQAAAAGATSVAATSASAWKTLIIAATAATSLGAGIYWYVSSSETAPAETPALTQTTEKQAEEPLQEDASALLSQQTPETAASTNADTPTQTHSTSSASTTYVPRQENNVPASGGKTGSGRPDGAQTATPAVSPPVTGTTRTPGESPAPEPGNTTPEHALSTQATSTNGTPVADEGMLPLRIQASETEGPVPFLVTFTPQSAATRYEWSFGDGNTSTAINPSHEFAQPGTYTVTLTAYDEQGRKNTEQVVIEAKSVSSVVAVNVFSPNNDGINDYFMLDESRTNQIDKFFIQVFDLSGKILFESNDTAFRWDGRDREGRLVPAGVYRFSYQAIGKDGKPHARVDYLTITY